MIVFMHTSYDVFDLIKSNSPSHFDRDFMMHMPASLNMARGLQKPMGGIWGSPVNDRESTIIWEKFVMEHLVDEFRKRFQWLSKNEFDFIKNNPATQADEIKKYALEIRNNAFYYALNENKLYLPSKRDIKEYIKEENDCVGQKVNMVDFDQMRKDGYDGIYYYEKKDANQFIRYFMVDHWDVDSSVVWNPDAIIEIEPEIASLSKLTEGTLTPFDAFDPKANPIYVYNWIKTNRNTVASAIDSGILNREKVNQFLIERRDPKYKINPDIAIKAIISKAIKYAEEDRTFNEKQIPACQYCIDHHLEIASFYLPRINRTEEGVYIEDKKSDKIIVKPLSECKPGEKIVPSRRWGRKDFEVPIKNITKVNGITIVELTNHTAIINSSCEDVYKNLKSKGLEIQFDEIER